MQTVSQAWKEAHKQTLLNESDIEIALDIADPDALEGVLPSDNGAAYISDTPEVTSEVDTPTISYGTLEQNIWVLNDTRKSIPESNYKDGGYIGDVLSNAEGVFDIKIPTITLTFPEVFTQIIPGITITWGTAYGEYATHFIVTAYNGDTVVATKEILDNDTGISVVTVDIANYDRITIQVLRWCLPNHRARVDEIFVGWHHIYSKSNLMGYTHKQTVDPISTSLPIAEIKFSLDNSDGSYNPYNLNGLSKYLTERQKVQTRYGLKLGDGTKEWIKGGTFYLSEWYAKQNGLTADFAARDALEFMSAHYKDTISTVTSRRLSNIATDILLAANLPLTDTGAYNWALDLDRLQEVETTAPIPDDTIANCLQLIANAGRCVLYVDRNGKLHMERMGEDNTDYVINSFNAYSKPEITLSKSLKAVVVKCYTYTKGDKDIESSTTDVTVPISNDGEVITIDNPLITDENVAHDVGEWVGNYLKNRMTLKAEMRVDVRLDALDKITNEHDYGTNNVRVTDVEFTFNGAFRGKAEGRVI